MTSKTLFTSVFFIVFACSLCAGLVSAQKKDISYKAMEAEALLHINKYRKSKGLKPLVMNDYMCQVAEEYSRDMGARKVPFGHNGMDERVARINKQLKQGASRWAENIASGQRSGKGVVEDWLASTGHRENIEGDYDMTGIGIAKGINGNLYFTQIFIHKKSRRY